MDMDIDGHSFTVIPSIEDDSAEAVINEVARRYNAEPGLRAALEEIEKAAAHLGKKKDCTPGDYRALLLAIGDAARAALGAKGGA